MDCQRDYLILTFSHRALGRCRCAVVVVAYVGSLKRRSAFDSLPDAHCAQDTLNKLAFNVCECTESTISGLVLQCKRSY